MTLAIAILMAIVVFVLLAVVAVRRKSHEFQAEADIVRLTHLRYYVGLIEEFHTVAGRYPLQGRTRKTLYVFVSNPDQHEQMLRMTAGGDPRRPSETLPFSELVAELSEGLGRKIPEYYDPQLVATKRPNFYIYMLTDDVYHFAVHLSRAFPFAFAAGPDNYKVEVTNNVKSRRPTPQQLFESHEFLVAMKRPLSGRVFFDHRDNTYLHASKRLAQSSKAPTSSERKT